MSFDLPNELILMIISHCKDLRTLKSFCLTSKMCLAAAQKLIFNLFKHTGEGPEFLRTLIQRPDLARQVRTTQANVDGYDYFFDSPDNQGTLDAFTETLFKAAVDTLDAPESFKDTLCALMIVKPNEAVATLTVILCTHLETLHLTGFKYHREYHALIDFAHLKQKHFLAHLRHLRVDNWDDEAHTGLEVLAPFFIAAPNLETFEGQMLTSYWRLYCPQLKTISLVSASTDFVDICDMLASAPVLQEVEIANGPWISRYADDLHWALLGNALRTYGTTLQSFQLHVMDDWRSYEATGPAPIGDLTSLAHLSTLQLPAQAFSGVVDDDDNTWPVYQRSDPITALPADSLVTSLPHSLRTLFLSECSKRESIRLSAAMDVLKEARPAIRACLGVY